MGRTWFNSNTQKRRLLATLRLPVSSAGGRLHVLVVLGCCGVNTVCREQDELAGAGPAWPWLKQCVQFLVVQMELRLL